MLERLLVQRSDHGALTLVHVYRAALQQARLLAHVWEDPHLYTAHRYLVRVSAETLLETRPFSRLRPTSRPKTVAFRSLSIDTQRRWARCIKQVRNLANANAGWPHAVTRALDQAYARRGKLRHELMQSLQPPHPSPAVGENARYPRRLRMPEPPPALEALLYAREAQRSSPPRPGTLECPPKLAQAIDSISRVPGKRLSRRREANARWRWLSEHMSKLRLPLGVTVAPMGTKQLSGAEEAWNALRTSSIAGLESRAQSHGTSVPRRVARAQKAGNKGDENNVSPGKVQLALDPEPLAPYLLAAHRSAERWSMPPVHPRAEKRLRRTGWVRSRVDYYTQHRARRRQWARLLSASPLIQLQAPGDMRRQILAHTRALDQQAIVLNRGDTSGLRGTRSALRALNTAVAQRPEPAGIAAASASKRGAGAPALHTIISPHALYSGRGRRRPPPATRAALSEEELAWIRGSE